MKTAERERAKFATRSAPALPWILAFANLDFNRTPAAPAYEARRSRKFNRYTLDPSRPYHEELFPST